MAEITLIRHGQASYGTDDYDRLSDLGHQQSRWLGAHLAGQADGFDRVIRGSLRRHRETTEGISSALPLPPAIEDARLNELDYDALETGFVSTNGAARPTSRVGFLRQFPDVVAAWETDTLPGQPETYASFQTRILAALDDAAEGRTLVITSGGVIGTMLRHVLDLPLRPSADLILNIFNASVHRIRVEDGRFRLCQFNATPHLDPPERAHARTYI